LYWLVAFFIAADTASWRVPDFRGAHPRHGPFGHRGARFDIVSIILYFLTLALSIAVITIRQLRISRKILFRLGKK
jgi:hypothetical protein